MNNQFKDPIVRVLMLKGEKGDKGTNKWGSLVGGINNQTDLIEMFNNQTSETDTKLSEKLNKADVITPVQIDAITGV